MTLTGKVMFRKKVSRDGEQLNRVRRNAVFAKMPIKLRASCGSSTSHLLKSAWRLLKSAFFSRSVKTSICGKLAVRLSKCSQDEAPKIMKVLACFSCPQYGSIVMRKRARSSLFASRSRSIARKSSTARNPGKSPLMVRKVRTLEKYDSKKEKKASKDNCCDGEKLAKSMKTVTPFDRSSTFDELKQANFTVVRKLGSGINGDVFKYNWRRGDSSLPECVAVKKLRNACLQAAQSNRPDERSIHFKPCFVGPSLEDALTEIGVLSYLSRQPDLPRYLLKLHGVFAEPRFTWLVTELADGGEMYDLAASENLLPESRLQTYMWQLLQAVEYLHRHCIGHRDISLENALLKDGVVKLMDFGMAVCSRSQSGVPLRYFCIAGKDFYRAPEMYVPKLARAQVVAPIGSAPNSVKMAHVAHDFWCEVRMPESIVPGQTCMAEVCGYTVPPADMFAVGVCLFMLAFQCPPWEHARLSNACFNHFFECTENALESLLKSWGKQPRSSEVMLMLKAMLHPDPSQRPSAASCLEHPWLSASV